MSGTTNREMDEHQPILVPRVGNATFLADKLRFSFFFLSANKRQSLLVRQNRLFLLPPPRIIIIIIIFKDGKGREELEEIIFSGFKIDHFPADLVIEEIVEAESCTRGENVIPSGDVSLKFKWPCHPILGASSRGGGRDGQTNLVVQYLTEFERCVSAKIRQIWFNNSWGSSRNVNVSSFFYHLCTYVYLIYFSTIEYLLA